jgi:hypothetical protein
MLKTKLNTNPKFTPPRIRWEHNTLPPLQKKNFPQGDQLDRVMAATELLGAVELTMISLGPD